MTKRQSINIESAGHGANPIPLASLKGGILATGAVYGWQPDEAPSNIQVQCKHLFSNIAAIMKSAGGTVDDIIKVSVQIASANGRKTLNEQWVQMFPDELSRPARHVSIGSLANTNRLISVEFLAVLDK